jgi:transposase-like protein
MTMWFARRYDPAFAARIIELASAEGLTRAELATALGVSERDFDAWAETHADFAVALADSDSLACAWWDTAPRRALATGEPFRVGIWAKAVAQRYGRSAHRPLEKAEPDARDVEPDVIIEIPDNGRSRRRRARAAKKAADQAAARTAVDLP